MIDNQLIKIVKLSKRSGKWFKEFHMQISDILRIALLFSGFTTFFIYSSADVT